MSQESPDKIIELARERIAERERIEQQQARKARVEHIQAGERFWQALFLAMVAVLLLVLFFWPGATLEWKLYATVHGLVAQKHTIVIDGRELPVCARNLGIYSAYLISLAYLFGRGLGRAAALPSRPILLILGLFMLTMVGDGVNSLLEDTGRVYFYPPRNDLRTITGALFGLALTPIILFVFNRVLRANAEPTRAVLDWSDLIALLGLNGIFVVAAHSGLSWLFWPLAFLGVIGILSELFTMHLLVAASVMGYRNAITRLTQLARPACLALITTGLFTGGLAWLRFAGG